MQNWFDLLRFAIPLVVLFGLLPAVVTRGAAPGSESWRRQVVRGFLSTAVFMELSCILLGRWQQCLPGMVFGLYTFWILAMALIAFRKYWLYDRDAWRKLYDSDTWRQRYGRLLIRLESLRGLWGGFNTSIVITQGYLVLMLLILGAFLQFLWHPLHNLRFLNPEGYTRTLSLQALVNGSTWPVDATVALMAPIVFGSGLDAATVVRLGVPVVYLMMLCAIAYCTSLYASSPWASAVAVGLFWIYCRGPGFEAVTVANGSQWASLFLILAACAGPRSLGYVGCALLLAWLSASSFPELFAVAIGCILVAVVLHGFLVETPPLIRSLATTGLVVAGALAMTIPLHSVPVDGPFQYEASAQTASRIAREFPRNRWLIVSPMHEVAFSYGRGWHMELPQFLDAFSTPATTDKSFRFPYEVQEIFIFVEKRPLPQTANLAVPGNGANSFYYSTNAGRASMAFRAAEFVASYSALHSNTTVYFEDHNLMVYRISQ